MPEVIKLPLEGENKGKYIFHIINQGEYKSVTIPGYGGGREGPMLPDYPEQESWMRTQSGLKEIWYLTWEISGYKELLNFKKKLNNFTL